jgi:hypothetical protein
VAGFSKQLSDDYYPKTYIVAKDINFQNVDWFLPNWITPQSPEYVPFNLEPIRPKDVKNMLRKTNQKSTPGPDGIPYGILLKLQSSHHLLATLFNKVLESGQPPPSWSESLIKLVHKKGSVDDPKNFRMLALTGCIGKTYNLLLSHRFTS